MRKQSKSFQYLYKRVAGSDPVWGIFSQCVHAQLPLAVDWNCTRAYAEQNDLLLVGHCSSLLGVCRFGFCSFMEMIAFKGVK